jgi:tetrapyrrole methylase family protein/MazG family protein
LAFWTNLQFSGGNQKLAKTDISDLLEIMAKLRGENGCPWDKAQTTESLKPFLLEEAYEVIDAIERNDQKDLVEELGDLLLQVVFHSRLAEERGDFDFYDVVSGICQKMIHRHPHIFGEVKAETTGEVLKNWEEIKREEKDIKTQSQSMAKVPKIMPALMRAYKVQEKAARVGFDWDDVEDAMNKVTEELCELREVYKGSDRDKIREEMGDLLFAAVNVARLLEIDAELALKDATSKFIRRFSFVEQAAAENDKHLQEMTLEEMDELWEQGKSNEKK